jgi:Icc-related predicted phosphoesterase
MRRFLLCGGFLGREKSLEWLRRTVDKRPPEGLLIVGGILDTSAQFAPQSGPPQLAKAEAIFVERFFETLGKIGLFAAVIPGIGDLPLKDFLRMGMHAEVEFPGIHLVHATLVEAGDLAVCGLGGPLGDKGETATSRIFAEYHLRALWAADQSRKVLMLAEPPRGKLGGDGGSHLTEHFIDSYHPALCVVGGLTHQPGSDRVARTSIVSPGHIAEGSAVWLDWTQSAAERIEFLDVRDVPETIPVDIGAGD